MTRTFGNNSKRNTQKLRHFTIAARFLWTKFSPASSTTSYGFSGSTTFRFRTSFEVPIPLPHCVKLNVAKEAFCHRYAARQSRIPVEWDLVEPPDLISLCLARGRTNKESIDQTCFKTLEGNSR